VKKGEILGFLGPNGAGKTTTMRILTCFTPATEGTATIAGYDIFDNYFDIQKIMGYLPETPPLYLELTAREYLLFVAKLKNVPKAQRKGALDNVIQRCGLEAVIDRVLGNLSKGYRQRVGIAQALINSPKLLILDEPTSGLDPKQIIEIRELIKSLAGEHTVILSTHILPEVTQTCQKIIILNKGSIVAEDTYEQLSAKLKKSNLVKIVSKKTTPELISSIKSIKGVTSINETKEDSNHVLNVESKTDIDIREDVARLIVNSDCGLLELTKDVMSLEDVFLQLITKEEGLGN